MENNPKMMKQRYCVLNIVKTPPKHQLPSWEEQKHVHSKKQN